MKFLKIVVITFSCTSALIAHAETENSQTGNSASSTGANTKQIKQLRKRVTDLEIELEKLRNNREPSSKEESDDLEEVVYSISEKIGSGALVNSFDSKGLTIGGFLHSAYTSVDAEAGSASAFNRQVFELLIHSDITSQWSGFVAAAMTKQSGIIFNDPGQRLDPSFNITDKNSLVIGWANYRKNNKFNVRIGRYITPQGITNIEHFPATLLETEQPQFLRPFSGDTLFPNFIDGVMVHGSVYPNVKNDTSIEYFIFTGNYIKNSEELVNGGRLAYTIANTGITVGINTLTGQRAAPLLSDYSLNGVDILFDNSKFYWKTELFSSDEDSGPDRKGFYTQPAWRITPKWIVFLRHDLLEIAQLGPANEEITEDMLGINFLPAPNTRLRATFTNKTFEQSPLGPAGADADIIQLSATFSF